MYTGLCYMYVYCMWHKSIYYSTCMYNTPQVTGCTPPLSWLFYSYARLQCYIHCTCIYRYHTLQIIKCTPQLSWLFHSYALLRYAIILHIYRYYTLQVIKCTPPLSRLFYSYAMLCYATMLHIYLCHTLVIKCTPLLSWLFYIYAMLSYNATYLSLSYTSGHQIYSTVILAMLGKIGAAAAFAVIYVWSAELYPTVVRNVGMGASSSCARIGGMVSPYIADLVHFTLINITRFVLR